MTKTRKKLLDLLAKQPVKSVKIHKQVKDYDDGDPLYEVDATITFKDGTTVRETFTWVRAGHLHALKHPRSEDAQEMLEDLFDRGI